MWIIFAIFSAILFLNGWLRYKAHKRLQQSEEKCGLLMNELSERKSSEKQMFDEKERLKTTLESMGDGVISTDQQGNVELLNKVAEQLTGWTQEEAAGKKFDEVFNIINEFTREKDENLVQAILDSGKPLVANYRILIAKDEIERPIEENAAPIKDIEGNIQGAVLVFRDYTETKERINSIEYLSYRDQLTGLYNRRFYEEELKRLNTVRNLPISIIVGDVNGLKLVNDAFGHEKGDEFLLKAASAIRNACRTEDIVARCGGDEFVILLPKTKSDEAEKIVKRIKEFYLNEHVNAVRVSIAFGWETKRQADEDILKVLKMAENYMYKHKIVENEGQRDKTITAIIDTLHKTYPREEKHARRVSEISQQIGQALGLSEIEVNQLKAVGQFHDIGKIAIPESILNKPGRLTEQERLEIERHPDIGFRILNPSHDLSPLAEYILAHHERWDGTGYPKGIKGEAIPRMARIITLADSYDAMTSDRPYRKALSEEQALIEIRKNSGTQFDPQITQIFIEKGLSKLITT
ncbi:MAG TPA: HD domain-containing phosphohydrolase [Desulfosporosinus sp.]